LTPQEAYKIGFLVRCAEEGLSAEQTKQRVKQANWIPTPISNLLTTLGKGGLFGALVAPAAIGGIGGVALGKARDDDFDMEEAKKEEELAEYYRAIEQLSRSTRRAHVA
jgi:hypothetical protein